MTEQKEYCTRCHGSGRVGYVAGANRRGHTRCPDCHGERFKPSPPEGWENPDLLPAKPPAPPNAQQTPSWEQSRPRFLWGKPMPGICRMHCDKCGRFVSESGDDTIVVGGTSTYSHQSCPPVEPDIWCLNCVRKVKPKLYESILND